MNYMSRFAAAVALVAGMMPAVGQAQSPFESGWTLSGESSDLNFLSVKKGTKMELSKFAKLVGSIYETGAATFEVLLDSVDTSVDLRNVRMRFLLFETFAHPKAVIKTQLTEQMLSGLEERGVLRMDLPFEIMLHGFTQQMSAEVIISLAGPDQVTVASVAPLVLQLADFNLIGGRNKLQETAEVTITPATAITFALAFKRNSATEVAQPLLASLNTSNVALEPVGNLTAEACEGRFEILSRAGNINFDKGSDKLKPESSAFIASIGAILSKCPGMVVEVGGHTDSAGSDAYNLTLSERRAQSVVQNLMYLGLKDSFLIARGYGETQPVASNGTFEGRSRNRRIEFRVLGRTALDG